MPFLPKIFIFQELSFQNSGSYIFATDPESQSRIALPMRRTFLNQVQIVYAANLIHSAK